MSGTGKISEDLTRQVFGRLTVLKRAEKINGRTAWLCQCTCGNTKTVISRYLKNGKTQSCGCLRREIQADKAKDITGYRFGRLTALYPTEKRDLNGSVIWMCLCDCGNQAEISYAGLMSGNNISCGCALEDVQKQIRDRNDSEGGTNIHILDHRKTRTDNTSGFRGISKMKDGRYRVSIGFKRKRYYIGQYVNYSDAVQKRIEAEELVHKGYLRARQFWQGNEPLIYDVVKKNGILKVHSNDRHENGNFMICDILNAKNTDDNKEYKEKKTIRSLNKTREDHQEALIKTKTSKAHQ